MTETATKKEVCELLAAFEQSEGFLDHAAANEAARVLAARSKDDATGRRFGPYRVIAELGRGGMGTVYLAQRADGQFEQRVAIKLMSSGAESERLTSGFLRERQILSDLSHPNIARLLDGGLTEGGEPYLVMEYIEGRRIDRYCDEERLSIAQRLAIFRVVCAAVQHAHRQLVVHRDIKPGNILVTEDGTPKLLDFGTAKLLEPLADVDAAVPPTVAAPFDTPEYASPEQVRGEAITTASESYEERLALWGEENVAVARSLIFLGDVNTVQSRFETAKELYSRALEIQIGFLGEEDLDVADTKVQLGSLLRLTWSFDEAVDLLRDAVETRRRLGVYDHPATATALGALAVALTSRGDYEEALEVHAEAYELQVRYCGEEHVETVQMVNDKAVLDTLRGKLVDAAEGIGRAVAGFRRIFGDQHHFVAIALVNQADALTRLGQLEAAEPLLREALDLHFTLFGEDHFQTADALGAAADLATAKLLSTALMQTHRPDEAEAILLRECIPLAEVLGFEHEEIAGCRSLLQQLHDSQRPAE